MDLSEKDKFGLENRSGNPPNHHPPGISAEWQPDNSSMRLVSSNTSIANSQGNMGASSCPSVSMVDSFPSIWNYSTTSQNLGFCQNELQTSTSAYTNVPIGKPFPSFSTFDMDWNSLEPTIPVGPGILHPNLLPFPADPAFMELDSRLSCFKGGTSGGIVHPFVTLGSLSPSNASRGVVESRIQKSGLKMPQAFKDISLSVDHGSKNGSPVMNRRDTGCLHVGVSNNEGRESGYNEGDQNGSPGSANASGDSSSKAVGDKKRKRSNQGIESNQQEGSQKLATETTKENTEAKLKLEPHGNQVKDSPETPKEDYIHVRARHGQATNSHSLAERVRREKISERMKYLQELVPGCNKVTGKAVMLDEIINYVQSLQRQVEFLSMKLAAVNPHLDFDIEGFLAKELQSRVVPSSSIGFSPDMMLAQFHPSQQGLIQVGISGNVNPSDVLRRAVHAQLASMNAFKEHMPQAHNAWDSELQNIAQSTFMATPPINPQELNGKPWLSFP